MPERWYHGGVPGLRRGGKILPPELTGAVSVSDLDDGRDVAARVRRVHRKDVVYLTRSAASARLFASMHPAYGGSRRGGDLYEVVPDEPLEPDPDYLKDDGGSACCPSATIVAVVERRVPRPSPEAMAFLAATHDH